jgi:PAS domain S-box-containing protein
MNREVQQQKTELETAYQSKEAVVETALDAVIGMDDQGRIVGWNSQAEAVFGWSAAEALGRPLATTIVPGAYRDAHQRGVARFLASGVSTILNKRVEIVALHRDGHEFPVELSIAPIRSANAITFCAFARDITLRMRADEALRTAKNEAEAASQAKSAFLANMSHEIRTPLNAILGFTELLISQPDAAAQQRDYLQTIHDSGRHLLTLINDVLDLSKIESGQMQIETVRCSPHEIIAATISILRVPAQERGLMLEYFWKSAIPDTIQTAPARLRQILMNLVGNAIKFTEVGSVQVAARLQEGEQPQLIVDVIDTGVGIEPQAAERIFEPFVQADSSITRRFGGTGLGLSISRRLARLMGGDLIVNSQPGRGSIFTLTIPTGSLDGVAMGQRSTADVIASPPKVKQRQCPVLPPCRILLVEDGVTNRKLITVLLERAGAMVRTAENGQAGLEAVAWEPFDLIIMDMQMPVMDGYSATQELRRIGCTIPIIALTAHAMASDEKKCRAAGCSAYLTKPIDRVQLLTAVAEALSAEGASRGSRDGTSSDCSRSVAGNSPTLTAACSSGEPIVSRLPDDDPEFCDIIVEFVEQFESQVASLDQALALKDLKRISEIAHSIKGTGGTAGFDDLTSPAADLEKAARQGRLPEASELIGRLKSMATRLQTPVPR